jgi:hypothetical protein
VLVTRKSEVHHQTIFILALHQLLHTYIPFISFVFKPLASTELTDWVVEQKQTNKQKKQKKLNNILILQTIDIDIDIFVNCNRVDTRWQ